MDDGPYFGDLFVGLPVWGVGQQEERSFQRVQT
jgi:hypothetical protein